MRRSEDRYERSTTTTTEGTKRLGLAGHHTGHWNQVQQQTAEPKPLQTDSTVDELDWYISTFCVAIVTWSTLVIALVYG